MDIKKYLIQNKILTVSVGLALLISLAHVFFCVDVFNDIAGSYGPMAGAFGFSGSSSQDLLMRMPRMRPTGARFPFEL